MICQTGNAMHVNAIGSIMMSAIVMNAHLLAQPLPNLVKKRWRGGLLLSDGVLENKDDEEDGDADQEFEAEDPATKKLRPPSALSTSNICAQMVSRSRTMRRQQSGE